MNNRTIPLIKVYFFINNFFDFHYAYLVVNFTNKIIQNYIL